MRSKSNKEIAKMKKSLRRIINPRYVDKWFEMPNNAFGGLTPRQVFLRGDKEKLWSVIYILESGSPY